MDLTEDMLDAVMTQVDSNFYDDYEGSSDSDYEEVSEQDVYDLIPDSFKKLIQSSEEDLSSAISDHSYSSNKSQKSDKSIISKYEDDRSLQPTISLKKIMIKSDRKQKIIVAKDADENYEISCIDSDVSEPSMEDKSEEKECVVSSSDKCNFNDANVTSEIRSKAESEIRIADEKSQKCNFNNCNGTEETKKSTESKNRLVVKKLYKPPHEDFFDHDYASTMKAEKSSIDSCDKFLSESNNEKSTCKSPDEHDSCSSDKKIDVSSNFKEATEFKLTSNIVPVNSFEDYQPEIISHNSSNESHSVVVSNDNYEEDGEKESDDENVLHIDLNADSCKLDSAGLPALQDKATIRGSILSASDTKSVPALSTNPNDIAQSDDVSSIEKIKVALSTSGCDKSGQKENKIEMNLEEKQFLSTLIDDKLEVNSGDNENKLTLYSDKDTSASVVYQLLCENCSNLKNSRLTDKDIKHLIVPDKDCERCSETNQGENSTSKVNADSVVASSVKSPELVALTNIELTIDSVAKGLCGNEFLSSITDSMSPSKASPSILEEALILKKPVNSSKIKLYSRPQKRPNILVSKALLKNIPISPKSAVKKNNLSVLPMNLIKNIKSRQTEIDMTQLMKNGADGKQFKIIFVKNPSASARSTFTTVSSKQPAESVKSDLDGFIKISSVVDNEVSSVELPSTNLSSATIVPSSTVISTIVTSTTVPSDSVLSTSAPSTTVVIQPLKASLASVLSNSVPSVSVSSATVLSVSVSSAIAPATSVTSSTAPSIIESSTIVPSATGTLTTAPLTIVSATILPSTSLPFISVSPTAAVSTIAPSTTVTTSTSPSTIESSAVVPSTTIPSTSLPYTSFTNPVTSDTSLTSSLTISSSTNESAKKATSVPSLFPISSTRPTAVSNKSTINSIESVPTFTSSNSGVTSVIAPSKSKPVSLLSSLIYVNPNLIKSKNDKRTVLSSQGSRVVRKDHSLVPPVVSVFDSKNHMDSPLCGDNQSIAQPVQSPSKTQLNSGSIAECAEVQSSTCNNFSDKKIVIQQPANTSPGTKQNNSKEPGLLKLNQNVPTVTIKYPRNKCISVRERKVVSPVFKSDLLDEDLKDSIINSVVLPPFTPPIFDSIYDANNPPSTFKCPSCLDRFSSPIQLGNHLDRRSVLIKYDCPLCKIGPFIAFNKCMLKQHSKKHNINLDLKLVTIESLPMSLFNVSAFHSPYLPSSDNVSSPYKSNSSNSNSNQRVNKRFISEQNAKSKNGPRAPKISKNNSTKQSGIIASHPVLDTLLKSGVGDIPNSDSTFNNVDSFNTILNTDDGPSTKSEKLMNNFKNGCDSQLQQNGESKFIKNKGYSSLEKSIDAVVNGYAESDDGLTHCGECQNEFQSLFDHFNNSGKLNLGCTCDCKRVLESPCSLKAHKRLHNRESPYTCPDCGAVFLFASALDDHFNKVCFHPFKKSLFKCRKCSFENSSLSKFERHMFNHLKNIHHCSACSFSAVEKPVAENHLKNVHTESTQPESVKVLKSIKCDFCPDTLLPRNGAHQHIQYHTSEESSFSLISSYYCSICNNYDSTKKLDYAEHVDLCRFSSSLKSEDEESKICDASNEESDGDIMNVSAPADNESEPQAEQVFNCSSHKEVASIPSNQVNSSPSESFLNKPGVSQVDASSKICDKKTSRTSCKRPADLISSADPEINDDFLGENAEWSKTKEKSSQLDKLSNSASLVIKCKYCAKIFDSGKEIISHLMVEHSELVSSSSSTPSKKKMKKSGNSVQVNATISGTSSAKDQMNSKENGGVNVSQFEAEDSSEEDKMEVDNNSYQCSKCNFIGLTYTDLFNHMETHKTIYQCSDCDQSFVSRATLEKHLVHSHQIKNVKKYIESRNLGSEVVKENGAYHAKQGFYQCAICYKNFDSEEKFKPHYRSHGLAFVTESTST